MKRSVQIILCIACVIVFKMPMTSAQLSLTEDGARVEVNFNNAQTAQDLEKIKTELSARGIALSYSFVNYSNKGYLKGIGFEVDCKDGFSGGATTTRMKGKSRFGFFRDYRESAARPFGAGGLK